jgi:ATP-dependent helicase/nuclease subunit A
MNSKALKLFSASAGSGKTYRLTLEYIKLALHEVESKGYFRRILAVTFTIKAAEEMRARIIYYLTGISAAPHFENLKDSEKKEFLQIIHMIKKELEEEKILLTETEIINRAQISLQQILQDYGLFSVMTIDSFVQRLSSSFVDELDLPNQFDVIIDIKTLINQLIDRILDKVNDQGDNQLKDLLLSYAQHEVEEGKNWNQLRNSLQKFFQICFSESFFNVEQDITKFSMSDFLDIEKKVNSTLTLNVDTLVSIAHEFNQIILRTQLPTNIFTYGERGPVGYFKKFINNPKIEPEKFTNLLKACENNLWFGGKANASEKEQIESISGDLSSLGLRFLELYQQICFPHQLFTLIKKDLKKMALLNSVQNELKDFQNENSSISISEFSRKIYEVISNDPVPFVYEKLGDRYFHILIDEFQDTSILQWQNFMPLIENAVSINKKNLLVGDAKQSIYKFRSGEVGLIASLSSQNKELVSSKLSKNDLDHQRFDYLIQQTETNNLGSNYRSSKEIVDFNNEFYSWISNQEVYKNYSDLLQPVYGNNLIQKAEIPEDKLPGQVDFLILEKNLSNKNIEQIESDWMLKQVLNLIKLNIENKNFQYKDIAILTRKNKDSNFLALQLKEHNIPVISADSLLVHYSPLVSFLISWFKLINEPNSELIFFELMFINADINQISLDFEKNNEFKKDKLTSYLQKAVQFIHENQIDISDIDFTCNSIVNLTYTLIHKFKLFYKSESQDYILKFLDIINEFSLLKSDTIFDFLEYFTENKSNLSIASPDNQNAITITSIHKSKGLEYPVVIIPFATWTHQASQEEIWFDISKEGPYQELFMDDKGYLNKFYFKVRNKFFEQSEYLNEQKNIELDAIFLDSLNMLYVATTRPKQQLHILVTKVSEEITSATRTIYKNSIANMIVDFIEQKTQQVELSNQLSSDFDDHTFYYRMNNEIQKANFFSSKNSLVLKLISLVPTLEMKPRLRITSSKKELFSKAANKRKKGELAHLILSKIDTSDTYLLSNSIALDGFEKTVFEALNNPQINQYFKEGELLFAEQDILCPNGQIIRPDRVVYLNNTTFVVDFKTGKKSDQHILQVDEYVAVLVTMGYEHVKGVIIYLESQEIVYV